MSARKIWISLSLLFILFCPMVVSASNLFTSKLEQETLAKQLGWVKSPETECGGYYLNQPLIYSSLSQQDNAVEITSDQTLFSQQGTSILEGKVTVTRAGQQITTEKAYLYRDASTGKLNAMDMVGDVHLRDNNTLIIAKKGRYDFVTKTKSLIDILYRSIVGGIKATDPTPANQGIPEARKITELTAWGRAQSFSQTDPKVYELTGSSYTTCPPIDPTWEVRAGHIVLDKNAGRGTATHARILVKGIPVFYTPYINFPIDSRRKTGFLYPTLGVNNSWGPYLLTPFYWNIAPNYDMTLTPGILTHRGIQVTDYARYLTSTSEGKLIISVLPRDRFFSTFQKNAKEDPLSAEPVSTNPSITEAELNRLYTSTTTRKSFIWRDKSQFNNYWSSNLDFNYVSDDYYLQDFGSNLNEITQNQLLQEADLFYKSPNWYFTGRMQAYQTLHPVNSADLKNQYRRFPQLILNADYPDQAYGLNYFINNEVTHFEILKTPGIDIIPPIGNRLHTQPGISLPFSSPYFFLNPRLQLALTDYNLYQTSETQTPSNKRRALPIFDIASGLYFNRNVTLFHYAFQQTLEPQVYYTYIPYRNQASIPLFDTTVNNLTYDQLFNYNRFTGLDRIGDANQIATGITTRLIDLESGWERARLGVGGIVYFANRLVTLCNSPDVCNDNPTNHANKQRLSPLTGTFTYHVNPQWSLNGNTLWNPISKQVDNLTIGLHYEPKEQHVINLNYNFVTNKNYFSGVVTNNGQNNIKLTDLSFEWPVLRDITAVGRWSQDWNTNHFQNLVFGLQYDTCCWAMRLVGERTFKKQLENEAPQYNSGFYLQFALKGLSTIGTGDASGLLNKSIPGYKTHFGQE